MPSRSSRRAASPKGGKASPKGGKATLNFPVAQIHRQLTTGKRKVAATAPIYLTAVLEYVAAEILELAGNIARGQGNKKIDENDIMLAISKDSELKRLVGAVKSKN